MTQTSPSPRRVDAQHPIHELLHRRWSPRAFADRPIAPEDLCTLLEAARWAPSSANEQPWSFIVARRDQGDAYARLLDVVLPRNRQWAGNAPVLMLSIARLHFERYRSENRHAFHDVGLATACMMLQATDLGIHLRQIGGFDLDQAIRTFAIPPTHTPVTVIALGYPGDAGTLPEDFARREQTPTPRRPLEQFVFAGTFGQAAPWLKSTAACAIGDAE